MSSVIKVLAFGMTKAPPGASHIVQLRFRRDRCLRMVVNLICSAAILLAIGNTDTAMALALGVALGFALVMRMSLELRRIEASDRGCTERTGGDGNSSGGAFTSGAS